MVEYKTDTGPESKDKIRIEGCFGVFFFTLVEELLSVRTCKIKVGN